MVGSRLKSLVFWSLAILFVKVLGNILYEYRWYFPADFQESAFLIGREESFRGLYVVAFYTHLLVGPVTLLLAAFLMLSRGRGRWKLLHRYAGRLQMLLIFTALVPSGLVMATQAFAGPIAGVGFAGLSLATGFCAAVAMNYAITRRIALHERWATRTFLLLVSPMLLRLISGALIVTQYESEWAYRLNAWVSWLIPLIGYEIWLRHISPAARAAHNGTETLVGRVSLPVPILAKTNHQE